MSAATNKPKAAPVSLTAATLTLTADPAAISLKRAAWAYGCCKKGSPEERHLRDLLQFVIDRERGGQ